ncbi:MAG: hypothetical protein LW854_21310 [Rubrivivax sp.]|nr:hypothetical protein [Rubrivivax sp.]
MSLRHEMPHTAAFIDELRAAFGAEGIDAAIRAGLKGEPDRFHATEAGREVGTPFRRGAQFDARPSPAWLRQEPGR